MAIKPEKITAVGPAGTNGPKEGLGKALQRVVRLWRVSNPQASLASSDRVNYTILEEEIYVHSFRLCPLLAVWTVSGHPLGTLDPVGMLWRRGCAQEPQELEKALEDMVRDWRADQGVTLVG